VDRPLGNASGLRQVFSIPPGRGSRAVRVENAGAFRRAFATIAYTPGKDAPFANPACAGGLHVRVCGRGAATSSRIGNAGRYACGTVHRRDVNSANDTQAW
jgi:hypothetical protein